MGFDPITLPASFLPEGSEGSVFVHEHILTELGPSDEARLVESNGSVVHDTFEVGEVASFHAGVFRGAFTAGFDQVEVLVGEAGEHAAVNCEGIGTWGNEGR